ncbi:MAG: oligosaccharide flippase family protein [Acetobacteraceae bacterium]|nr:oligosaccharide flippase family protein [Acetobacteraceae bacterium]
MSVRRNVLWMAAAQGCAFATQFATTVVLARLLTPYEMGVFAAALAVLGLLTILRSLGLGSYVIRVGALTPAVLETTFTVNLLSSLLISAGVAGLSVLGGAALNEPGVQRVLLVVAVVPLVSIFEFRPAVVMERHGRFRGLAAVNIARAVTGAGVALVLAYRGHSYMSLAYGQLAGGVVAAALFNAVGWRHVSLRCGLGDWREVMRYGAHMLAISATGIAATRLAELALARMLGLNALGMYSRASGVANMLWESIHMTVSRAVFVDLAEQRRQGRSMREGYLRMVAMMAGLLWPVFTGLAVVSGPVVVLLYGQQWLAAQLPLSLLALSSVPVATIALSGGLFMVAGRTGEQARLEAIRAAVGLVLFLGGCMIGLDWAAASRVLEAVVAVLLTRRQVQDMTGTRERDFTAIYLRSLALTVAAVGPAVAVMAWHGWNPLAPLGAVAAAILAGVVLWAVLLHQMRHPLIDEAAWLLGRLRLTRAARQEM